MWRRVTNEDTGQTGRPAVFSLPQGTRNGYRYG